MITLKCPNCGEEFYVNPPVLRQKRTKCPSCNKMQLVEDYPRTGRHDGIFMTKEERQEYAKAVNGVVNGINKWLDEVENDNR